MYAENVTATSNRILIALQMASPSLRREARQSAQDFTNSLNKWVDHRRNVIGALSEMCDQLNEYKKMSLITMGASSSVGVVSSLVAILNPPLAIGGILVGLTSSLVGGTTEYIKRKDQQEKVEKFQKYMDNDTKLLTELMNDNKKLESVMKRVLENEHFHHELQNATDLMSDPILIGEAVSFSLRSVAATCLHSGALSKVIIDAFISSSIVVDIALAFKCFFDFKKESPVVKDIKKLCELLEKGIVEILMKNQSLQNNGNEIEMESDYVQYSLSNCDV